MCVIKVWCSNDDISRLPYFLKIIEMGKNTVFVMQFSCHSCIHVIFIVNHSIINFFFYVFSLIYWHLYNSHHGSLNYHSHLRMVENVIGYEESGLNLEKTTRLDVVDWQESLLGWRNVVVYILSIIYGLWY